jgi:hypothetical protein
MTILAGFLILMCAGLMVGHGYHLFHHKEAPKTEHHMTMPGDHDHGQAAETSPENQKESPKTVDEP